MDYVDITLNIASSVFALFSLWTIVFNYSVPWIAARNKRKGIKQNISSIYAVPQITMGIAYILLLPVKITIVPRWVLLILALMDISLWILIWWYVKLVLRKMFGEK